MSIFCILEDLKENIVDFIYVPIEYRIYRQCCKEIESTFLKKFKIFILYNGGL